MVMKDNTGPMHIYICKDWCNISAKQTVCIIYRIVFMGKLNHFQLIEYFIYILKMGLLSKEIKL